MMKSLTVQLAWRPGTSIVVGHLAEADRRIYFEYDTEFLSHGVDLSPFKLPRRSGLIEHTDRSFGPLPGLFDDSLPDGWGMILMDRAFRRRGLDPATASPLDRLCYLGTRTMGALTYHPPQCVERDDRLLDLHEIGQNAEAILRGEAVEILPALMRAGGSPAGARPKILVGLRGDEVISGEDDLPDGFSHWIVKFPARADSRDAGPLEYAYSLMARAAGVDIPETRLIPVTKTQAYFAVRRFDRPAGNRRMHTHTFGNLIHANFRIPSTDYGDLLKVTGILTRNHADAARAFRQMIFNVAAHNRDDHAKNFGFILDERGEWSISPAYDVVFSAGPGGEHTMAVAGEGRQPTREHILSLADPFGISRAEAERMIEEVNTAVAQWHEFADAARCARKTTRAIGASIRSL